MKTAFSTVACMGSDWKSVLAWATAARQDAVEIRLESDGSAFGASDQRRYGSIATEDNNQ